MLPLLSRPATCSRGPGQPSGRPKPPRGAGALRGRARGRQGALCRGSAGALICEQPRRTHSPPQVAAHAACPGNAPQRRLRRWSVLRSSAPALPPRQARARSAAVARQATRRVRAPGADGPHAGRACLLAGSGGCRGLRRPAARTRTRPAVGASHAGFLRASLPSRVYHTDAPC
jgi:hypothetical protein